MHYFISKVIFTFNSTTLLSVVVFLHVRNADRCGYVVINYCSLLFEHSGENIKTNIDTMTSVTLPMHGG